MDDQKREIQRVLLNRTHRELDGSLAAVPPGMRLPMQGLGTGWGALHLLGMTCIRRQYRSGSGTAAEAARVALSRLGRSVRLEESPQAEACLCRSLLSTPVLITTEQQGTLLTVSAYTARGALSALRCRRALDALEKSFPEALEPVKMEKPPAKERKMTWTRQRKKGKREAPRVHSTAKRKTAAGKEDPAAASEKSDRA